jgi:hypothetical protein
MHSKFLIPAGLVLAFVLGSVASGFYSGTVNAIQKPAETAISAPQRAVAAVTSPRFVSAPASRAAVSRTSYTSPRAIAASEPRATKKRSLQKEALIIGGGAGAGAAIGAIAGGGKGAAVGAVSGGVAGLVYDLLTRNN